MFQECLVIAGLKPVAAEEHELELCLKIVVRNFLAVMIFEIARRMREISDHTNYLSIVADLCLSAVPVAVRGGR